MSLKNGKVSFRVGLPESIFMEEADLELSPGMNRGTESGVPPRALRGWGRRFTQQINDNKLGTDMKGFKWQAKQFKLELKKGEVSEKSLICMKVGKWERTCVKPLFKLDLYSSDLWRWAMGQRLK